MVILSMYNTTIKLMIHLLLTP